MRALEVDVHRNDELVVVNVVVFGPSGKVKMRYGRTIEREVIQNHPPNARTLAREVCAGLISEEAQDVVRAAILHEAA
jgi:hypothetical protein